MLTRAMAAVVLLAAPAFEVSLPVDCAMGVDCFVQQYADRDPGPGVKDYACGSATYDGHDGTDIRVRTIADLARGVAVVAAAPGTVKGVRDGMLDRIASGDEGKASVKDKECGNGALIDHGGGWETQYCHMREGSVAVVKGQEVKAGERLGLVGYSGLAEFPHVHLTVRKNGKAVDPFRPEDGIGLCGPAADPLWDKPAEAALVYTGGDLLALGFAPGPVKFEAVLAGPVAEPDGTAPAIVAWFWAINLRKGDTLRIALDGPGGALAENEETLDRDKAQFMLFAGRKRPKDGWPAGRYVAKVTALRGGKPIIAREAGLDIR